ncbi:MAG: DUF4430 domain-containing protein [Candidatus Nomurabacteria bacterium]|jgi:hypothetical protein|nr:DUF4430 domain-containing protein [Candidatus Nomurabacteria bacterium]
MAKVAKKSTKSTAESFEGKQRLATTIIACLVLLCVFITGIVIFVTKAQNDIRANAAWQAAVAQYPGEDGKSVLDILIEDFGAGVDERADYGKVVVVIEGTAAAEGYEWGVWVNDERKTEPVDQIATKNGDKIVWKIVGTEK